MPLWATWQMALETDTLEIFERLSRQSLVGHYLQVQKIEKV